jgi:hypothetical protein
MMSPKSNSAPLIQTFPIAAGVGNTLKHKFHRGKKVAGLRRKRLLGLFFGRLSVGPSLPKANSEGELGRGKGDAFICTGDDCFGGGGFAGFGG